MFYSEDKTAIFIDGSNTHYACQGLKIFPDYKRIREYFQNNTRLVKMFYYTAMLPRDETHNPLIKLVDWLSFNGFCVRQKAVKTFETEGQKPRVKGNMDIELCVDAMRLIPVIDHFVLFTGDGDFRYLVDAIQSEGKTVTAISTIQTQPRIMADELRRQVDNFIDWDSEFVKQHFVSQNTRVMGERVIVPPAPENDLALKEEVAVGVVEKKPASGIFAGLKI